MRQWEKEYEELLSDIQEQVASISKRLDERVGLLARYGLITEVDKKKMYISARASAEAVFRAVHNEAYPLEMKRELALRLLEQFDSSVEKILHDAESKVFSKEFLMERLIQAEVSAATEANALEWYQRNRKMFKKLRQDTLKKIRSQREFDPIEAVQREVIAYRGKVRQIILDHTIKRLGQRGQFAKEEVLFPSSPLRKRLLRGIKKIARLLGEE